MNLYAQYSYDVSFCIFRKQVADLVTKHVKQFGSHKNDYLCISRYLELSVLSDLDVASDADCMGRVAVEELAALTPQHELVLNYENIDQLAYTYIIVPSQQPETKHDVLRAQMLQDYDNNLFPNGIFEPYFSWKKGEIAPNDISCLQLEAMTDEADRLLEFYDEKYPDAHNIHDNFIVDDPWQFTRGYGEDKRMVAYLGLISDQLVELQLTNRL